MTGPGDDAPGGAVGEVSRETGVSPVAAVDEARHRAPDGLATDELIAPEWDISDEPFLTEDAADWAWVEEWRAGGEPVPWGPGLALSGFTTALVASAVYVLSAGLSDRPIVAIGVNVLVAGGLGPALWLSRSIPVLRWIAGGAAFGVLLAWLSVFVFLA